MKYKFQTINAENLYHQIQSEIIYRACYYSDTNSDKNKVEVDDTPIYLSNGK